MLTRALTGTFAPGANQRYADRRVLRLNAELSATEAREGALIHNISKTGMLVSASSGLAKGETIEIAFMEGKTHAAEVVWADEGLFGCRFSEPLSQAELSAALLRSDHTSTEPAPTVPAAQLEMLRQHWAMEGEAVPERAELQLVASAPQVAPQPEVKLPLARRFLIIMGLGAIAWAVPAAILYLIW